MTYLPRITEHGETARNVESKLSASAWNEHEYLCHRLRNGLTALSCAATDMCTVGGRDRPPGTQMSVGSGLHMDQYVYEGVQTRYFVQCRCAATPIQERSWTASSQWGLPLCVYWKIREEANDNLS